LGAVVGSFGGGLFGFLDETVAVLPEEFYGLTPGRVANPRGIQAMCESGRPPVWETFRDDVSDVLQLKKPMPIILFQQLGGELKNLRAAFESDEILHKHMLARGEALSASI
jgi:hypothetical protein